MDEARWIVEADRRTYAPVPELTKEEQRALDLKIIADFEAQYPKPKSAAAAEVEGSADRVERAFRPASSRSSLDGALAPEGRDSSAKKPPVAADEIEIKAEAAQSGR